MAKTAHIAEFGDFQTPEKLGIAICNLLGEQGLQPASVIEPTCGLGNLLFAAIKRFPTIRQAVGFDVNPRYVDWARRRVVNSSSNVTVRIDRGDFFEMDWRNIIKDMPQPILVIGNPPWVTNAHLGTLGSGNLPEKSNFQGHAGLDAMTGKSNFDISEWMLMRLMEWLKGTDATMAMLCKTAVARKILLHSWKNDLNTRDAAIYNIDAGQHFDAAVDASLLVVSLAAARGADTAAVYPGLAAGTPSSILAYRDHCVLADLNSYDRWRHLQAAAPVKWRSGIKHDCAKVMELRRESDGFRNGLNEPVDLEETYVFPMLKSSDVANGCKKTGRRWMLVTQHFVGEDTQPIQRLAPRTWQYLQHHAELLDRRASSIYKGQPPFSVFGVGDYSYAPWKVAISGFYKRLAFALVPPAQEKPVMLDDTCYFLPCDTKEQAETLVSMLNSTVAREFFSAFVFWDAKRPITVDLLRRLSLNALANELGIDVSLLGTWESDDRPDTPRAHRRKKESRTEPLLW
jgi:hypothetical protein